MDKKVEYHDSMMNELRAEFGAWYIDYMEYNEKARGGELIKH